MAARRLLPVHATWSTRKLLATATVPTLNMDLLARLAALPQDKAADQAAGVGQLLSFVAAAQAVDTAGVAPLNTLVATRSAPLRADVAAPLPASDALAAAPFTVQNFFAAPKVRATAHPPPSDPPPAAAFILPQKTAGCPRNREK